MVHKSLGELANDAVRALAWSMGGPSLLGSAPGLSLWSSDSAARALSEHWDWLMWLDQDPSELHDHLAVNPSWKVGLYFEALLEFWLARTPSYQLLARNLQVQAAGRTLGALDFVVRDSGGAVEHWEVAVKFYLQHEPSDAWGAWVGPNKRDRLDRKLDRMRDHQVPLSATPEAAAALARIGVSYPDKRVAVVKGTLFEAWDAPGVRPTGFVPGGAIGQRVCLSALSQLLEEQPRRRWCQREKPDWLGPARRSTAQSLEGSAVLDNLQETDLQRPQLWSRLEEVGEGVWLEDALIFLVPDAWTER